MTKTSMTEIDFLESAEEEKVTFDLETFVDETYTLKTQLDQAEALVSALKKEYKDRIDQLPVADDAPITYYGTKATVTIGTPAKKVTDINKSKLFDVLGASTFLALAKIGVGDIRKYLTPKQQEEVFTEKPEGPRKVSWQGQ